MNKNSNLKKEGAVKPGKNIRRFREGHGWTQKQLAKIVSITPNHLARVERNEVNLSPKLRLKLARAFGIGPENITEDYMKVIVRCDIAICDYNEGGVCVSPEGIFVKEINNTAQCTTRKI